MRTRRVPLRTCLACGQKLLQRDLVRLVRTAEGRVEINAKGNKAGQVQSIIRVINDSKHIVELHLAGADGKGFKMLEIAYVRTR